MILELPIKYGESLGTIKFGVSTLEEVRQFFKDSGCILECSSVSLGVVDTFTIDKNIIIDAIYERKDGKDLLECVGFTSPYRNSRIHLIDDTGVAIPYTSTELFERFPDLKKADIPGCYTWYSQAASMSFDFRPRRGESCSTNVIRTTVAGTHWFDDL